MTGKWLQEDPGIHAAVEVDAGCTNSCSTENLAKALQSFALLTLVKQNIPVKLDIPFYVWLGTGKGASK